MNKSRGQIAYEAYCGSTEWKSLISGQTLPQWAEVKTEIKESWEVVGEVCRRFPKHLMYGRGQIKTNKGKVGGRPCLTLRDTGNPLPVGTTSNEGAKQEPQEAFDVILSFENIEGARVLQDMLNELIAEYSRELSPKMDAI